MTMTPIGVEAEYGTQHYINFVIQQLNVVGKNEITDLERNDVVGVMERAIDRYSQDNPRVVSMRIEGNGNYRYTLPTDWRSNFSKILGISIGLERQRPYTFRHREYTVLDIADGNGPMLHFLDQSPEDDFLVRYTTPHKVTEITSTIGEADFTALGYLLCHHVCIALAGRLRLTKDSKRDIPLVDARRTKADEYIVQAKAFFELYKQNMGLPEKGPKAATLTIDMDLPPNWGGGNGYTGYGYLTHRT